MQPRLTDINRREVLQYLQYRGGAIPDDIRADLERCCDLILRTARPRAVWRVFDVLPGSRLAGTDFRPEGQDMADLLSRSRRFIMFAATLGSEVEALVRRSQLTAPGDAVILDCCGSAAIENVCDNLCDDLAAAFAPLYLTDRFSPGYGDFPFTQQPDFCRVLDVGKRIGVSLTAGGLMIPQKSVTAVLGVCDTPQEKRPGGCICCNLFETCMYRKDGVTCAGT